MSKSTQKFIEPARELEVIADADVVVVGGGAGGFGAAIAAARNGAKTLIIERFGALGGTWTHGILGAIMSNNSVRGIFAEFQNEMAKLGGWRFSYPDDRSSCSTYDSEIAKIVLEEMAVKAGVSVIYFAQVANIFKSDDGRRVTGVVIQSKEGRHVVTGKIFIDASGDGDLCALAGVPFESGREGDHAMQPMTMIFNMGYVDDARAQAYFESDPQCKRSWKKAKELGEVTVPIEDVLHAKLPKPGGWNFNATRLLGYDGTKLLDVSKATTEARRQVAEIAGFMRKHIPGFENALVTETAPHIGVRETRRIHCDYTLTGDDIQQSRKFPDVIARGNWYIDIHNPKGAGFCDKGGEKMKSATDAFKMGPQAGDWYEIPYRSTTAAGFDNILVASRCIDADHEGHSAVRASHQICAVGEGVGTAAGQVIARNLKSVREVDVSQVQTIVRKAGGLV